MSTEEANLRLLRYWSNSCSVFNGQKCPPPICRRSYTTHDCGITNYQRSHCYHDNRSNKLQQKISWRIPRCSHSQTTTCPHLFCMGKMVGLLIELYTSCNLSPLTFLLLYVPFWWGILYMSGSRCCYTSHFSGSDSSIMRSGGIFKLLGIINVILLYSQGCPWYCACIFRLPGL